MSNGMNKQKLANSRSLSNTLYILIDREARGNAKQNYSSSISSEYGLAQGSVSGNLNDLDSTGVVERTKEGRRNIFQVNWKELTKMLFEASESAHYFDLPREELVDLQVEDSEEYESHAEVYDEFLEDLEEIVVTDKFQELFKQVMLNYCKRIEVEKSEGGHLNKPPMRDILLVIITQLSELAKKFENELEAISSISDISEDQALDSLRVEDSKKELLVDLKPLWVQSGYIAEELLEEVSDSRDIITEEIDQYFGVYSRKPLMIEKDFLDRLP